MAEYIAISPPDPTVCRTHKRVRDYRAKIAVRDLPGLRRFVETKLNGNDHWVVREIAYVTDHVVEVQFTYGPVHGNYPSDVVDKVLDPAGIIPVGGHRPKPFGQARHVRDGSCQHYNCVRIPESGR